MSLMKAAIFVEPGRIVLDDKPIPDVGPTDALMKITTTTICGTDTHILKGEYPVARGLTIGHEPVGIIEKLGSGVTGYCEGQRVIAGAITPSGIVTPPYADAIRRTVPTPRRDSRRPTAGASATRLTAARQNICWFPMPWPTSARFPTSLAMSRF